jgi:hypothetical protein
MLTVLGATRRPQRPEQDRHPSGCVCRCCGCRRPRCPFVGERRVAPHRRRLRDTLLRRRARYHNAWWDQVQCAPLMKLDVLTSHLQNRPAVRAALGWYRRSLFAWWLLQHDTGRHVSCLPLCRLNFETLAAQDWSFRILRPAESCEWPRKETLCHQLKIRSSTKRSRFCGRAASWALGTSITLEEHLAHPSAPLCPTLTFAPVSFVSSASTASS